MKISCIVTSHNNEPGLNHMITQLRKQDFEGELEILVYASNTNKDLVLPGVTYTECPDLNDWGQQKRADGLEAATGDLIGFFNDDDLYSSHYLKEMTDALGDADIVACDFSTRHLSGGVMETEPRVGRITSGNFLIRSVPSKTVGYTHRSYQADGLFIEDCVNNGAKFVRVKKALYVHR